MTKDELLTQLHHAIGEWMTAEMAYRNAVQQVRHANELARQAEDRLTVAALRKSSALEAFEACVTAKASVAAVNAGSSVRPTFSVSADD